HRLDRALRCAGHLEGELAFDLARAKQAHTVFGAADETCLSQSLDGNRVVTVERASVDRALNLAEIKLVEFLGEDVVEAAFRKTPMEGHLAPFEPLDRAPRARFLAFGAFARPLA